MIAHDSQQKVILTGNNVIDERVGKMNYLIHRKKASGMK